MNLSDPKLSRQQCFINGQWIDATSGDTINVTNPATGEVARAQSPRWVLMKTKQAIDAANTAWPAWRAKTAKERAGILRKWYELMMENQDDLGVLMTAEQGKPLAEAKGEVGYAASFIEWFAEEGKRIYGDTIPQHGADKRIVVTKEPVGVVAAITPWNFPAAMITRKAGPALAAGCHRHQTSDRNAVFCTGNGRIGGPCGRSCWHHQRHHRRISGDRRRTDRQPDCA